MKTTDLETKLTTAARESFENGAVFVYNRDGVYWLAVRTEGEGFRTMLAVGIEKSGLKRMKAEIQKAANTR